VERKEISGFPGYLIDSDGSVWSTRDGTGRLGATPKRLSLYRRPYGARYTVVCMRAETCGRVSQRYVHRLVLEAFVGPCPPGQEALHGPRGTADNSLANLRWGTHVENNADKLRDGTYGRKLRAEDVREAFRLRETGLGSRAVAARLGVGRSTVQRIWKGSTWACLSMTNLESHRA
jgi:hypothetical protein